MVWWKPHGTVVYQLKSQITMQVNLLFRSEFPSLRSAVLIFHFYLNFLANGNKDWKKYDTFESLFLVNATTCILHITDKLIASAPWLMALWVVKFYIIQNKSFDALFDKAYIQKSWRRCAIAKWYCIVFSIWELNDRSRSRALSKTDCIWINDFTYCILLVFGSTTEYFN